MCESACLSRMDLVQSGSHFSNGGPTNELCSKSRAASCVPFTLEYSVLFRVPASPLNIPPIVMRKRDGRIASCALEDH